MNKRIFSLLVFVLCMGILGTVAFSSGVEQQKATKQLEEVDLKQYFGDIKGCAVFYSNKDKVSYVYNSQLAEVREIPCSTFKIVLALAGMENQVIADEHTVMRWDGVERSFPQWNQDLSMMSAIQLSATWYFDKITETIGMEKMDEIVQAIQYGNMDSSGGIQLWATSLKISPMEQIDFVRKLFRNELPFTQKNMDSVKKAMYIETEKGKLYGKTGTSGSRAYNNGNQTAWFVGDYVTDTDEYYFALRIYGDKHSKNIAGGTAQAITQKILNDIFTSGGMKEVGK